MRKSKKTIIYMLVALVVAVSAVLVDFGYSYAQSSFSDVPDADWHYWEKKKGVWTSTTGIEGFPDGCPENYPDISSCGAKYLEQFKYRQYLDSFLPYSEMDCSVSADSEIVCYINSGLTQEDLDFEGYGSSNLGLFDAGIVCKDKIYFRGWGWAYDESYDNTWKSSGVWGEQNKYIDFANPQTVSQKGDYFAKLALPAGGTICGFMAGKMKVFNSFREAVSYLNTGDTSGLAWQGGTPKQEFDSGLLLNDFDVQFHDSNKFEECYLDVKYTIPEELKSVSSFQIDMEEQYDWCGHFSGSVSDWEESHTGTNYIDVLNHADGFRIYLKDIKAIDNFIDQYDGFFNATHKRQVLGSFTGLNIPFGDYLLGNVKVSCLDVKFHLVANKKYGHYVDYNLNLLTGIGVKNSYVPDTDGNYTSNNDSKVNGHYYTDVGTDAAGNTTYNYYYYYPDGGKEKVSSEDAANNTITNTVQEGAIRIDNSPTFNNNITVEGDTISNSANSYADSKSDATKNKSFIDKFLGFFEIIENNSFLGVFAKVFGWLPAGVSTLITTALGIVVGIRVFKFFK